MKSLNENQMYLYFAYMLIWMISHQNFSHIGLLLGSFHAFLKGNPNKMTELVVPKLVWMFQKETIRRN